jgi:hypothetical protein
MLSNDPDNIVEFLSSANVKAPALLRIADLALRALECEDKGRADFVQISLIQTKT